MQMFLRTAVGSGVVIPTKSNPIDNTIKSVLLGVPGKHKTKLADQIASNFNFVHLSVPQIISGRVRDGSTVSKVLKISRNLKLQIPDDYTVRFVTKEASLIDDKSFVITGFPSTLHQTNLFWKELRLDLAIYPAYSEEDYVRILAEGSKRLPTESGQKMRLNEIRNVVKNYTKRIAPILRYYERQKVLFSCSASTETEMWERVKEEIFKRVRPNVSNKIKPS